MDEQQRDELARKLATLAQAVTMAREAVLSDDIDGDTALECVRILVERWNDLCLAGYIGE